MSNVNATKGMKREWLSIITASVKTNVRAHNWLVKSGAHYVEFGDTSLIVWAMDNAWSSGMKRESMVRWIAKHLKVKITAAGPKKAKAEVTNKNRDRIDMGVASGDPFYLDVEKAEKEDTEFDLDKLVLNLVRKAVKENPDTDETVVKAAVEKAFRALAEKTTDKPVFDQIERGNVASIG
jgi:hypothetical protein